MQETDKDGYKDFIAKSKKDHEEEQKKVNAEKEKKRIIQPLPLCAFKIRVSKVWNIKKDANVQDTIKLFDFEKNSEIKKSFLENEDAEDKPLDQPKIYLNLVYHDKVLAPLKKDRKAADPKNDSSWDIIPIHFAQSKERWSGSGMKCLHIDAYVNTCVFDMFKSSMTKI